MSNADTARYRVVIKPDRAFKYVAQYRADPVSGWVTLEGAPNEEHADMIIRDHKKRQADKPAGESVLKYVD